MPPYFDPAKECSGRDYYPADRHFCRELDAQLKCTQCGRQMRFADNVIVPPIHRAIDIDPGTVDMRHCDCTDACADAWREQSVCRCDKSGMDNPHVKWRCIFHSATSCGNFYPGGMVRPPQKPKLLKPQGRIMSESKTCGVCEAGPGQSCVC